MNFSVAVFKREQSFLKYNNNDNVLVLVMYYFMICSEYYR